MSRARRASPGPQLIFSQITGQTVGRRIGHGQRLGHILRRQDPAQPVVQRQPGAAPQPRRRRRAGDRPAADQVRRARRHDFGRSQAQQGPLPARPGERRGRRAAAQRPRDRPRPGGRDRDRPTFIRGSSISSSPAGDLQVTGLGINSRWTTNLQIGGLADAPRFTGRADLVRGDYDFAGRNFRLDRGIIRFRGESPPDPLLDIHAVGAGPGPRRQRERRVAPASSPRSPSPASRRCRRTSCCRASCSAPRSPTCRRPRRCSWPRRSPRSSRASGSLDPINALRRAVGLDRLRIVPADVATGQKTAIARRQVHHPQIVRGGGDRRAGLFGDAGRISDDPLALDAVDRLDHRPLKRGVRVSKDYLSRHLGFCLMS